MKQNNEFFMQNKDITILIPYIDNNVELLNKAIDNIKELEYDGTIKVRVIVPSAIQEIISKIDVKDVEFIVNTGETDYCSQINYGVSKVDTEYFSIMEYDDHYNTKWFKMFNDYLRKYSDVSIFLPINVIHDVKSNAYDFVNHIAWSTGFTASQDNEEVAAMDNIGFITFNALKSVSLFNLTGGIFKTKDWLNYKPSIKVAFNYEYLLRATNKGQMVYVVPKEGYYHEIFREGSLSSEYLANMDDKENAAWFELAKSEYIYESDRHISIKNEKEETLK